MCSLKAVHMLLRVDSGAPALPHGPAGLPRLPQYDAVHAHGHAVQPRGHVVQSAVTRTHPESEEEGGRHAEPTAYLSQGVSGPVQRRVAPWHTLYGIGAPGALEKSVCYLPSHGRAKAAIFAPSSLGPVL